MKNTESKSSTIVIVSLILIIFTFTLVFLLRSNGGNPTDSNKLTQSSNVLISDNLQTISIEANDSGYAPTSTNAKADINTKLLLNSVAAYGCAQSLTIPKLGIKKILPNNGKAEVEIPAQKAGTKLLGTCSMGMYSFTINFI
jgi:plastocyanin domain-containing protein